MTHILAARITVYISMLIIGVCLIVLLQIAVWRHPFVGTIIILAPLLCFLLGEYVGRVCKKEEIGLISSSISNVPYTAPSTTTNTPSTTNAPNTTDSNSDLENPS